MKRILLLLLAMCMLTVSSAQGWSVGFTFWDKKLQKKADKGDARSQFKVAITYLQGRGIEKSEVEAAKWMKKAADQGYIPAVYNMAVFYHDEIGVKWDANQCINYLRKAAEGGHDDGQYYLGECYQHGVYGLTKDYSEAMKWFQKS